jgi:ribosomal protein S18 acetylase RimI-like enzyme
VDVVLRPVTPEDEPFLRRVYASTRAEELAPVPWTDEQKTAFCDMQYAAQKADYTARWDEVRYDVVLLDGAPAGRLWQSFTPDEVHVLDIAILPEFRGRGVGELLLRDVMDHARQTGRPATIYVEKTNRARNLYARLGFVLTSEGELYDRMEWRPSS